MALKLIANYSKRLGLPGYSSHQFSVCVETEISSIDDVAEESARLYRTLQHNVDEEIQATGFVPPPEYGMTNGDKPAGATPRNGNGNDGWACSDKQRELILKLVDEQGLDKREVEDLAQERFSKPVKSLNKLEASGLIDELFERTGGGGQRTNGNGRRGAFRRNGTQGSRKEAA